MFDLRRLLVLNRFSHLGSIAAVAIDLGYTPSAISQQLSTLEREAGIALLERTARSANLTDAGRELAAFAATILSGVEEAQSRMRERAGSVSGRVILSSIPGLAVALAPYLAEVQRRHPALTIVAHETLALRAEAFVLDGQTDVAVVDDWTQDPEPGTQGLHVTRLLKEEVMLAVPSTSRLAARSSPITATKLQEVVASETWLCAPVGQLSRSATDLRLAATSARPSRRWEFEGLHVLAALVGADSGVALLPAGIAREQAGVSSISLAPKMYRRVLALTRSTILHDPAVDTCLRAIRDAFTPIGHAPAPA